jgi:predicted nucleic acid-binding protein
VPLADQHVAWPAPGRRYTVYAISRDPAEQDKAIRATDILAERDLALSVQVLQEFYVQVTRASRPDAIGHRQRFRLSYWDAAIIEAARALGCTDVLSEALSDGQDYGGVRVANPFR